MSLRIGETIITGGGSGSVSVDNKSITKNVANQIQTVGVINSKDNNTSMKSWTGTLAEYLAIPTKDNSTIYNITDDQGETAAYTRNETDTLLAAKANADNVYTKTESNTLLSHKLNDNQITNCITELPQNVKLELNNGVLTLKAGSKVYIPDGFEEDDTTKKFNTYTFDTDVNIQVYINTNRCLFLDYTGHISGQAVYSECYSGATAPSGYTYMLWYDTTNNLMKYTKDSGSTWHPGNSLPIAVASGDNSTSKWTSIDQVFNGFGYIGSTVFALPGVKGLIPNGRNADGSLKNNEIVLNDVQISNAYDRTNDYLFIRNSGQPFGWYYAHIYIDYYPTPAVGYWYLVYDTEKNLWYQSNNGDDYYTSSYVMVGKYKKEWQQNIQSLSIKEPFRALDYSDTDYIAHQAMPSEKYIDLALGASGTSYTAPADGWFMLRKTNDGAGQYIQLRNPNTNLGFVIESSVSYGLVVSCPASKGQKIYCSYNATGATDSFRFVYSKGAN